MDWTVRKLEGRYRQWPLTELRILVEKQMRILEKLGARHAVDDQIRQEMPLWRQAEFWEMIIEFELEHSAPSDPDRAC